MRDAELRFATLRLRIEERAQTRRAARTSRPWNGRFAIPGDAKVTTTRAGAPVKADYEVWISDGDLVRTYAAPTGSAPSDPSATARAASTIPTSRVRRGSTSRSPRCRWRRCPTRSSTRPATARTCSRRGAARSSAPTSSRGREAILLECDHPRTIELVGDRPDFRISIAVDRDTGVILRLVESIGGAVTRHAEVIELAPDAPLPPSAFEFVFPTGTTMLY